MSSSAGKRKPAVKPPGNAFDDLDPQPMAEQVQTPSVEGGVPPPPQHTPATGSMKPIIVGALLVATMLAAFF